MPRNGRTNLAPPENQALQAIEESSPTEPSEEPEVTELDNEIECPRCAGTMVLNSSFDKLVYSCESCSFLLRCV
jgi:hypothetical protein